MFHVKHRECLEHLNTWTVDQGVGLSRDEPVVGFVLETANESMDSGIEKPRNRPST